jgi:hypothetical protein
MNICLIFVLYNLQKLWSWIIYKVHVHVHILPNRDRLVPEYNELEHWRMGNKIKHIPLILVKS